MRHPYLAWIISVPSSTLLSSAGFEVVETPFVTWRHPLLRWQEVVLVSIPDYVPYSCNYGFVLSHGTAELGNEGIHTTAITARGMIRVL